MALVKPTPSPAAYFFASFRLSLVGGGNLRTSERPARYRCVAEFYQTFVCKMKLLVALALIAIAAADMSAEEREEFAAMKAKFATLEAKLARRLPVRRLYGGSGLPHGGAH